MDKVKGFMTGLCLLVFLQWCCTSPLQIRQSNRKLYPVNSFAGVDSSMVKIYRPYKEKLDREMNQVIGSCDHGLSKNDEDTESSLGDFFTDACLVQALKVDPDIDFAMTSTNGGLRSNLPAGALMVRNFYELMPFENELVVLDISGQQVLELADFIAASGGQPVAGLKMKIGKGKANELLVKGMPVSRERIYHVLTSDYLASGGDNAKGLGKPVANKTLNIKVRDALIQYVKEQTLLNKKITAQLDGRITKD